MLGFGVVGGGGGGGGVKEVGKALDYALSI